MIEDKEAEIMAGLETLLQKIQEIRRLTEGLHDESEYCPRCMTIIHAPCLAHVRA